MRCCAAFFSKRKLLKIDFNHQTFLDTCGICILMVLTADSGFSALLVILDLLWRTSGVHVGSYSVFIIYAAFGIDLQEVQNSLPLLR